MSTVSFLEILESGHTKEHAARIINAVLDSPVRLEELMNLFFSDDNMICQRASWSVGLLGSKNPKIFEPYFPKMIEALEFPLHDAIVRNTLRTWKEMEIPEEYEGVVFERCYNYLVDVNQPVAIRVFAMCILSNIAVKYPELIEELIPAIEDHMPYGTAGFKSRGKKELLRLKRVSNKN